MYHSIYHDLIINASISKVYAAITEPEHLVNWWPKRCSGKPQVGEVYNFFFTPQYDWLGKVIKAEPNRAFHIKMTSADADWDPTSFGFDLEETASHMEVHFWHIGWPDCNAHFKRSSFCWAILLKGLKDYVEKGVVVPFEERE